VRGPARSGARLVVVRAGLQDLVVDCRPRRALRFGLVEGGPLDVAALLRANRAVGNPSDAAGLESLGRGPTLQVEGGSVRVAVTGELQLLVDGRPCPRGRSLAVVAGSTISVAASPPGLRGWLAVAGGLELPLVFGSRSVDRPGRLEGLAGRALALGDHLPVGPDPGPPARSEPPSGRVAPPVRGPWTLRVLRGPQWTWVAGEVRAHLLSETFTVSPQSDRTGLRLLGRWVVAPADRQVSGSMLSEGTAFGAVQLTPEGGPLVLLADRGSLGGYPKPLQVITADAPLLAQARPGTGIRFRLTTPAAARRAQRLCLGRPLAE